MKALVLSLLLCLPAIAEPIALRWGTQRDIQEIVAIEAATNPKPFGEKQIRAEFDSRTTITMVAIHDHRVVGYLIYDLNPDSVAVKRLVVHPEFRGVQVAEILVNDLLGKLRTEKRPRLTITVPKSAKEEIETLIRKDFDVTPEKSGNVVFQYDLNSFTSPTVDKLKKQTLYERLAIAETANAIEIERAYRRKKSVAKSDAAHRLLDETFSTLSDPIKKKRYDEALPTFPGLVAASEKGGLLGGREGGTVDVALRKANPKSKNLYERLGVPSNATREAIEIAYWDAVKRERKDANQYLLDEAYRVLGRDSFRQEYDWLMTGTNHTNDKAWNEFLAKVPEALPSTLDKLGYNPHAVDPYEVLGIAKDFLPTAIDRVYQHLADQYQDNEEVLAKLDKAYAILSNPALREAYDAEADKLSAKEKREKVEFLFSRADEVIEKWFDESHEGVLPDYDNDELLDQMPPQSARAETLARGSLYDLYALIGVTPTASAKEIESKIAAIDEESFHILGILPEDAKLVLLDAKLRKEYDKFREGLGTYDGDRDALGDFVEQAKLILLLRNDPSTVKLTDLAAKLSDWRLGLVRSPAIASQALEFLKGVYLAEQGKGPVSLKTRLKLLDTLRAVTRIDAKSFPDLRSTEMALRALIVRDAVSHPKATAKDMETLLASYLENRPPDFLSAEVRGRRDQLNPPKPLVRKADCDGFDVL